MTRKDGVRVRTGLACGTDAQTGADTFQAVIRLSRVDAAGVEVEADVTVFDTVHATKRAALDEAREAAEVILVGMRAGGDRPRCLKCPCEAHLTICRTCGCCSVLDLEGGAEA